MNRPVHVKVPVVIQLEALECGAASLCMIMAYYGRWIPLERVREDCGVSRDGSNLKSIYLAASSYGMNARAFRYSAEQLRTNASIPCIVHWENNHFVVLDGFKGDYVYLNDPARGTVRITFTEFKQSYSGVCMFLEPAENFVKGGKPDSILKFARERLKGTLPVFALIILTTLITHLTGILTPLFSRFFVDYMLDSVRSYGFFVLFGLVGILQFISLWIKSAYMLKLQGKMAAVANTSFMWHILRMPLAFFEQRMAGDIALRQRSNQEIAGVLINTFAPLLLDAGAMILNLILMLNYSPLLAGTGLLCVACNLVLAHIISQRRVNITRVQMRDKGKLDSATMAGIDMIETIKSSGAENSFFVNWAGHQASFNEQVVKYSKLEQYIGQLPGLLTLLTGNIVLFLGVRLVMAGHWTAGIISAFNGYLNAFSAPAASLIAAGQSLQEMRTNMERVQDVFKYPEDVNYDGTIGTEEMNKLSGLVELRNVTFGYNRFMPPLLKDFSLTVKPGGSVALVGASGCGKSTVSKLMTGLCRAWQGEILYDGHPLHEISRNILTGSIACVDQGITLFNDTISNNIRMWDKSIENFEAVLAARDAGIHEDIMHRPGDYQIMLLENGRNFSGGQCQRLEIARALAQDPTIIILDEATSALDAASEHQVIRNIEARGITRVIISHRLSIVRDCDEIIVMQHGEVIDRGRHQELMARCEYYRDLITNE